jgi:hypothetical protein
LWILPLIRIFLPDRPQRDGAVLETIGIPADNFKIELMPIPELSSFPTSVPWEWLWLLGLGLWLAARLIIGRRFRTVLNQQSQPIALSPTLADAVATKIRWPFQRVAFHSSSNPSAPFVTGLLKPAIFLPNDFANRFSVAEQSWIIIHELTHVKRNDLWVQGVGEIVRALFWFNPLIHFAVAVMQEDQELACDSSALSNCDAYERQQYGAALMAGMGPHLMPSILTFFSKSTERFTMLSKHKVSNLNTVLGVTLCALISVFALTKAPPSIAQRPVFDEVYDANAPVMLQGTITSIDQFEEHSHIYVDNLKKDGSVEPWIVEGGGRVMMEKAGLTQAIVGRKALFRGYQTLDKSCDPVCMINGRDIEFIDG